MKGFQKPAVMAAVLCVAFAACGTKTSDDYSRQTAEGENGASAFEEQAEKAEPSEADMTEGKIIHGIIAAGWAHTVALKTDGTVVAAALEDSEECHVSEWSGIQEISAGWTHTVGLKSDGTVIAAGNPSLEYGQTADTADWTGIAAIAAGNFHTIGMKADGTLLAVGNNNTNACELSDWTNIVAFDGGHYYSVGVKADGTAVAVGTNSMGQCNVSEWTDIGRPE